MEEKKLADDRISNEHVENNIVSDVDARDTVDEIFEEAIDSSKPESFQGDDGLREDLPSEEVKDSKVGGESDGEANPGFVTFKMNGDEGEGSAETVSETAAHSISENGVVSSEKKAVLLPFV